MLNPVIINTINGATGRLMAKNKGAVNMDLLTCIASEFNILIIRKDQKVWFFRTKGEKFYYDFIAPDENDIN